MSELNEKQKSFVEMIRKFATDYGIDVDDPEKGRWNFDSITGKFTKV